MTFQIVGSDRGTNWLYEAFDVFKKGMGHFFLLFFVTFAITIFCNFIPFLGSILSIFIPVFLNAGIICVMNNYASTGVFNLSLLFEGFKKSSAKLIELSILTFLFIVASFLFTLFFGVVLYFVVRHAIPVTSLNSEQIFLQFFDSNEIALSTRLIAYVYFFLAALIMVIAVFVGFCAQYFGAGLVLIHQVAPLEAISLSVRACSKNWWPLTIYSLFVTLWGIAAVLTLCLGFLVLFPVLQIANYLIYKDIFAPPPAESSLPNTTTFDKH